MLAEVGSIGARFLFLVAEMGGEALVDFLKRTLGLPARLAGAVAPAMELGLFYIVDDFGLGISCSIH